MIVSRRTLPAVLTTACLLAGAGLWGCRHETPIQGESLLPAFEQASFLGAEPVLQLVDDRAGDDPMPQPGQSPAFVLGEGWGSREAWGAWGMGGQSVLQVQVLDPALTTLWLEVRPFHQRPGQPQRVALTVNDTPCGTVELRQRWSTYRFTLPPGTLHPGVNQMRLAYAYHDSPHDLGRSPDVRQLAVGIRWLGLGRGDAEPPRSPAVHVDEGSGRVELTRPGRLLLPVALAGEPQRLAMTATVKGGRGAGRAARLTVRLERLDGREDELLHAERRGRGALTLASKAVPLPEHAAGVAFLELDARFPADDTLVLDSPRLLAAGPAGGGSSETAAKAASKAAEAPLGPPPDIVVILLDAARADHFGCYGYPRPTTPNIDRLAAESLVFRRAYAEAPYTVASVPTLLTGLPPTEHGVIKTNQRLPDSDLTAVEYLKAVGYATVGISASPNNSVARGDSRGYDEFDEVWRGGSFADAISPYTVSSRAVARLKRGFGERPFFMFLHFVPPHEPYRPARRFDVFGDPSYRGPVDGSKDLLKAIRTGALRLSPADLARLMSLYDANLRTADDAVEQVLAALAARPRWRDTAVIILADHGEAFFEHGQQGHNTTVYTEMLHVPLILRLPPAWHGRRVDTDRLVSLGDVAPTIMGLAGVSPSRPLPAVNLLAPAAAGDRVLIARSGGDDPQWGVLTTRWAAVVHGSVRRELYDLQRDPGETVNIAARRPLLLDGLVRLLRLTAARKGPAASESELSPQEVATLKSLGYL